jgi:hypothetical protein
MGLPELRSIDDTPPRNEAPAREPGLLLTGALTIGGATKRVNAATSLAISKLDLVFQLG